MFALNGIDAPTGFIAIPEFGLWRARVLLATEAPPPADARVTLAAGSLTLVGTVESAGAHVGLSEVLVRGGSGGWSRRVKGWPHRADNGVRLSEVVASLAAEVGETAVLEPGAERLVGYAWVRHEGPATTALEDLTAGTWWMAPDGVMHVGVRPARGRVTAPWSVVRHAPAEGFLVLSTPGEDLGAFLPGGELRGEGIAPFEIGALEARWSSQTVRLAAWRR
jgi:hypothetical protein